MYSLLDEVQRRVVGTSPPWMEPCRGSSRPCRPPAGEPQPVRLRHALLSASCLRSNPGISQLPLIAKEILLHAMFLYLFQHVVEAAIFRQMCLSGSLLCGSGYVTAAVIWWSFKLINRASDYRGKSEKLYLCFSVLLHNHPYSEVHGSQWLLKRAYMLPAAPSLHQHALTIFWDTEYDMESILAAPQKNSTFISKYI